MAITNDQIRELRRMVAEPSAATYSDEDLEIYISRFPKIDALGRDPFRVSASSPPALEANPDWTEGHDLNAAASQIWTEKASALATKFDFQTDGQSFSRSQMCRMARQQARTYGAKRSPSTITLAVSPLRDPEDAYEPIEE